MVRIFIIFLCFLISSCDNKKKSDYPNIILVMTDDQGWGQTGYYNHPLLKTPNLDLMAKANIGLTYINVPRGFFNRIVIPFNLEKKQIDDMCFIQHLSNKYIYKKSWFSNFKINDVIS